MHVRVTELVDEGDELILRPRWPSDNPGTVCRLTIVESGRASAEIQLTRDAIPVLSAWLGAMMERYA